MPRFEPSVDTRLLTDFLMQKDVGESVSYKQLGEVVGRSINGGDPYLQSALRAALDEGHVFENVRGEGYRRLTDQEIVDTSHKGRDRLRRTARRSAKRLSKVDDFQNLDTDRKTEHQLSMTVFSTIASVTRKNAIDRLRNEIVKSGQELPLAKTLEAFKPKNSAA